MWSGPVYDLLTNAMAKVFCWPTHIPGMLGLPRAEISYVGFMARDL
jgi:hypothetical protein